MTLAACNTVFWPRLPKGRTVADVGGVATLPDGRVVVFHRGSDPVLVFDDRGEVLDVWGGDIFTAPHGIARARDGNLWLIDDGDHTVRKCTVSGEVLMTIGSPGRPAPFMSGQPFNRPTHLVETPEGDLWITDGYGNGCLHRFSATGEHIRSVGRCGSGPGEFFVPHNIVQAPDGRLIVADRENHRLQVLSSDGAPLAIWSDVVRPMALAWCPDGALAVGEGGPAFGKGYPNLGPRISFLSPDDGQVIDRFGTGYGTGPAEFMAPHGIAVMGRAIYVSEVANAAWRVMNGSPAPEGLRTIRKLEHRHG